MSAFLRAPTALNVFSTCPALRPLSVDGYPQRVIDVARWSERAGCRGLLIYTDNSLLDPWVLAQLVIAHTDTLRPLVAVQPAYMHPYAVAKKIASLGFLYARPVDLNMVAGGFRNDLTALSDTLPHDRRYDRLLEYTRVLQALLTGRPVTFEGEFYSLKNLRLLPAIPSVSQPGFFVSGSSPAARAVARAAGATLIQYLLPGPNTGPPPEASAAGVRVGIIARASDREAWEIARARFPEDRQGQLAHQLAAKLSDSSWHAALCQPAAEPGPPYWLQPFRNYYTFCPYLVGSHAVVATEVRKFVEAGYRTLILDVPASQDDLYHTMLALHLATRT